MIAIFSTLALVQDDTTPVQVVGVDDKKLSLTAEVVSQFARIEFEATERDGTKSRYVGIELSKLIEKTGVPQHENLRGTWLGCFVVIEAKDGYRAVFSLAELDSSFADRGVFLVDSRNGMPLDDKHGPMQLIAPDEKRVSRWVRMVTSIRWESNLQKIAFGLHCFDLNGFAWRLWRRYHWFRSKVEWNAKEVRVLEVE